MTATIWNPDGLTVSGAVTNIKYDVFTALAGQTDFTLVNAVASPTTNNLLVIVDGLVYTFSEFTVNSSSSITLAEPLDGGETVFCLSLNAVVLGQTVSDAQYEAFVAAATEIAKSISASALLYRPAGISGIEVIAHRGFRNQFPQNTLLAMSAALNRGADSLECDVQMSVDGTPILYHDTNLNTLTSGSGDPLTVTLAYMQGLTFTALSGTDFSSVRIPTFAQFLSLASERGSYVYPEIKRYRTIADIALMVNAVVDARMQQLCMFQSFNLGDLVNVRALHPNIYIGFLGASYLTDYEPVIDTLAALTYAAIVWDQTDLISRPAIIDYARSKGLDVIAYTVTDQTQADVMAKLGVRRIMTDVSLEN